MPLLSAKTILARTARSSTRGRPPFGFRRLLRQERLYDFPKLVAHRPFSQALDLNEYGGFERLSYLGPLSRIAAAVAVEKGQDYTYLVEFLGRATGGEWFVTNEGAEHSSSRPLTAGVR